MTELSPKQKRAAAIAAVCVVCAPLTAQFEGFVPKARPDPIGILTGCNGERVDQSDLDPSRIYTRGECMDRLRARLARDYAPKILDCLPELEPSDRKNEFAAMLDASFNAGVAGVCRSSMARKIHAGQWEAARLSYINFYTGSVTKRPVKGAMDSRRIASGPNKGKWFNRFRGLVDRRATFAKLWATPESRP